MDNATSQVLLGSLLGDGCITKNTAACKNYCFKEMHGPEQREYVAWKGKMLSPFSPIICGKLRPELFTKTKPFFTAIREEMYGQQSQKNKMPSRAFAELDHLGLLVWYLDDGTWQQGQLNIKCELFSTEDVGKIVELLNERLGLDMKVYDYSYTRLISFRKPSANKVLPIWKELFHTHGIPSSMMYKLMGE